jgi:type IV secretory pathway TraG/TraD family ATPase VirD4
MNRAFIAEEDRVPFYLYVDEFQNFATASFTKILSEARKYRLGLTLANQYITQIDPLVMGAIFGNIGSITTFNVGAKDADLLYKEFGSEIEAEDLTTMNRFQMLTRITIDGSMSKTFSSYSLTMPKNVSGHREKIIEQSRKRYGVKLDKQPAHKVEVPNSESVEKNDEPKEN